MKKIIIILGVLGSVLMFVGIIGVVVSSTRILNHSNNYQGNRQGMMGRYQTMMPWVQDNYTDSIPEYRQGMMSGYQTMMPWIQDDYSTSYWGPRCR